MKGILFPLCIGIFCHVLLWTTSQAIYSNVIDKFAWTLGLRRYVRSIVIHAGTTGTRLHLFNFYTTRSGKSIKLDKESNWEVVPPLHTFASNPSGSVKSLQELMEKAKAAVPANEWSKTSIILMATTGVSALHQSQQKELLGVVKQFIMSSGFSAEEDCITVLDGNDEGILEWFTINLILGQFRTKTPVPAISLQLGGITNEVAFVPDKKKNTITPTMFKYLTEIRAYYNIFEVYSRSYLNFGLNEARVQILQHGRINGSLCISPLIDTVWSYGGRNVMVRGTWKTQYVDISHNHILSHTTSKYTSPIIDVYNCESVVRSVLAQLEKPPPLTQGDIYATAAFYHRILATDLVRIGLRGYGTATIQDIKRFARLKCQETTIEDPFICMDLIYMYVLFTDIYRIPEKRNIYFANNLYGITTSWTLGAAFLSLQNRILPRTKYENAMHT
ncbi:hypothetical protein RUM44_008220 [Polyplax serrata]|uniref:Ectonucleoside triphosphate diphosphohydrolase 5 n=1 Tax=Polyplax serrata TaxID=468196 RepID=A0ABR1BCK7_POLSC